MLGEPGQVFLLFGPDRRGGLAEGGEPVQDQEELFERAGRVQHGLHHQLDPLFPGETGNRLAETAVHAEGQ